MSPRHSLDGFISILTRHIMHSSDISRVREFEEDLTAVLRLCGNEIFNSLFSNEWSKQFEPCPSKATTCCFYPKEEIKKIFTFETDYK